MRYTRRTLWQRHSYTIVRQTHHKSPNYTNSWVVLIVCPRNVKSTLLHPPLHLSNLERSAISVFHPIISIILPSSRNVHSPRPSKPIRLQSSEFDFTRSQSFDFAGVKECFGDSTLGLMELDIGTLLDIYRELVNF